jgi:hypothetical protein
MPVAPNKVEVSPVNKDMTRLTYTCMMCGQPCQIDVDTDRYEVWRRGAGHVQDIFPEMSASEREVMISGSHGKCFDDAFKDPEEDKSWKLEDLPGRLDEADPEGKYVQMFDDDDDDPYGYYEDRDDTGREERREEMEDEDRDGEMIFGDQTALDED